MGGLFGLTPASGSSGFDFSVLNDYYLAKSKAKTVAPTVARKSEPTSVKFAPWLQKSPLANDAARLRDALGASSFVDLRDSEINKAGVDSDHKKLFAIYKGLTRLQALAERSAAENALAAPSPEPGRVERRGAPGTCGYRSPRVAQGGDAPRPSGVPADPDPRAGHDPRVAAVDGVPPCRSVDEASGGAG